ncbi:MAG: hypothetical protein ACI352_00035 [Elusimicrobiaceae bacterium]|nr:hypothetical protein [Elusimicrobiota bacterium]
MKYFLVFVLLGLSLASFCQEGDEPIKNASETEQPAAVSSQMPIKEPSLEEFLKRQEELWLQEKKNLKGEEASSSSVTLPPPSVLTEEVQSAEEEEKNVKTPPEPKKANQMSAPRKKQSGVSSLPQSVLEPEGETPSASEQKTAEESSPEEKNNWPAFFKGCVFGLLLAAGVWLLSKYQ